LREDGGGYVSLVDIDTLLEAKTASQFVSAWGRMDVYWGRSLPSQWTPWRLMGLNLESVNKRGTLEWRVFNGVYYAMPAFLNLVAGVHAAAMQGKEPEESYVELSTPWILGQRHVSENTQLTILNDLCQYDFSHVWGFEPVDACRQTALPSHYEDSNTWLMPEGRVNPIVNNFEERDNGSETFPLYRS
jgi:hypothetical protein